MFVDLPEGQLFYKRLEPQKSETQSPETIIFLHGIGANHEMWCKWLPRLSPHYRLLLIDLRGWGASANIADVSSWTLDDVSNDILAVADHAGIGEFHAVGESFGGTAVLNLATRGLERLRSITTLSTAHRGGQIERVRKWQAKVQRDGIAGWSKQMMAHRFRDNVLSDEDYRRFQEQQDRTAAEPLLHLGELLLGCDLTSRLGKVRCPLLMISPDRSPFVTPDIPVEILRQIPSSDLCVIPGTRHGIFYSHGAFCAGQHAEFLDRRGSATR